VATRRFTMFRRHDEESSSPTESTAPSAGPEGESRAADSGAEGRRTSLFDREADTDEFALPAGADADAERRSEPDAPEREDTDERIREAELAATRAAEQRSIDEIVALEEDLERAKREGAARVEALEVRLGEAERRAAEAEERVREEEQEKLAAEFERVRAEAEADRDEQVAAARKELNSVRAERAKALVDSERSVEAAEERARAAEQGIRTAVEQAEAKARAAHEADLAKELARFRAEAESNLERELAATRRQLGEAHERAAAADRRAAEIEIEARREIEREREGRVQEIEGKIGDRAKDGVPVAEEEGAEDRPAPPPAPVPEGMLSLSQAGFDELRELGMSVTQAKRVIRHREEHDGFRSVDELDRVPGFPRAFLTGVKDKLVP
jgi:DNA uptake protein ComE-like DNA-binding protein